MFSIVMSKFVDTKKLDAEKRNSFFSEADNPNEENGIMKAMHNTSIAVMGFVIGLLYKAVYNVQGMLKMSMDIIGLTTVGDSSVLSMCQNFEGTLTNTKSKHLKTYEGIIALDKSLAKTYFKQDSASKALSVLNSAIRMYAIETSGIMSEALLMITTGKYTDFDSYINSNKVYKAIFEGCQKVIDEPKIKDIMKSLIKESMDISENEIMWMEATTAKDVDVDVSILRVVKALLMKAMYTVMAPVRYIIYLVMFGAYTIDDRIQQIKDTLKFFDDKNIANKNDSMNELSQRANKFAIDRTKGNTSAEKRISDDVDKSSKILNDTIEI